MCLVLPCLALVPVQLFRNTVLLVGPATSGRSGVRVYKAGQSVCKRFGTDGPDRTGRWLWWSLVVFASRTVWQHVRDGMRKKKKHRRDDPLGNPSVEKINGKIDFSMTMIFCFFALASAIRNSRLHLVSMCRL